MRVGMIGHKRIPSRDGGVETVVADLSYHLAKDGVDVVAYNRKCGRETGPQEYSGVKLTEVWTVKSKKLNALVYSYLATIRAIVDRVDVVHYHALGPAASLWLAKLFGKKVVVTVHGLNYKTPKWRGFGARYIKLGEKETARYADEIVVLSGTVKEYFWERYHRETHYIPNGVSMPDVISDRSILDRMDLSSSEYALCVSRLVPGKGLEALIDAFSEIKTHVRLVIAGDSDYLDGFKRDLKKRAEGDRRIIFAGFVGVNDLSALYSNARVFILPSEAEGMPMSLLEAMWFDCPCLVSDIPENTEVLTKEGWTFSTCDVEDLREKLNWILSRPRRCVHTGSLVRKRNSWSVVAEETLNLYRMALQ